MGVNQSINQSINESEAAKAFKLLRVHLLEERHPDHWLPQPGRPGHPHLRLNCGRGDTNGKYGCYLLIKCLAGYFQALVDVMVKYMDKSVQKDLSDLKASDPIEYQAFNEGLVFMPGFMDWTSSG